MARELDLDIEVEAEPGRTFGEPILVRPRLGQGAFRVLVTETYERRCAITGEACRSRTQRTSGPSPRRGSTASTTGSCSARTCTRCSTGAT
jgi:hypothetical protein